MIESILLNLILILIAAKIGGEIFNRLKLPPVLGELLAGIIIGKSVFNLVHIDEYIEIFAELGVIILLFQVGIESSLKALTKVGLSSFFVAAIGVTFPFIFGYASCYLFNITVSGVAQYNVAIFMGATLTATSVGITARVLSDLGKLDLKESQTILGAAVIDDVIGLVILSVVIGIVGSGSFQWAGTFKIVFLSIAFLVGAILLGLVVPSKTFTVLAKFREREIIFIGAVVWCFFLAFVAKKIGLATIVGAFAAGLALEPSEETTIDIHKLVKPVASIFVPIFFVKMGMAIDIRELITPNTLLIGGVITLAAVIGKIISGIGATTKGVNRLIIGVGMIPRGEVGLIFADYGLKHGIFDNGLYSIIILMVFITTFITPFWLNSLLLKLSLSINKK